MKKVKLFFAFILCLSAFSTIISDNAEAKTVTKYVAVDILNVREKPTTNSKKLGALRKNTKVTVYKVSKGWASIKYKKKTAYVSAQYLKSTKTIKKVSYKMNPKKTYIYYSTYDKGKTYWWSYGKKTGKYFKESQNSGTIWYSSNKKLFDYSRYGNNERLEIEGKNELVMCYPASECDIILMKPVKKGAVYQYPLSLGGFTNKVITTTATVKVKAGTFKKVAILERSDGTKSYYAQNVGLIKSEYSNYGTYELISYKNRN